MKRPLARPPLASAYAGKQQPKVVYISSKTHFMSAVKRIDKLLNHSEKRAVQSATSKARSASKIHAKDRRRTQEDDEIVQIAKVLSEDRSIEPVIAKATGKAISKAMQIGLWFQQRQQYDVQLRTASIHAIDDVQIDQSTTSKSGLSTNQDDDAKHVAEGPTTRPSLLDMDLDDVADDTGDYTRVRHLSVLEVHIRLR